MSGAIHMPERTDFQNLALNCLHDLRNPLAAIHASAELLAEFAPTSPQLKRLGCNIYRAACRMQDMLADLTTEARGVRKFEIVDLRDVISGAVESAQMETNHNSVDILLDMPDRIEMALNRSRMERAFFNLITNSIQAMPSGGSVRIATRVSSDSVVIEVEDTGPGIPGRVRDRLFEQFVTVNKEGGLGLGLAVTRQSVVDHGGDIWFEPAAGARFVIRLPMSRSACRSGGTHEKFDGSG
jgi:signal transduction histidine kinase